MIRKSVFIILFLTVAGILVLLFTYYSAKEKTPPAVIEAKSETIPTDDSPQKIQAVTYTKLQKEADALLPLFENMPSVPVIITDEVVLKTGKNTERGVAYTNCGERQSPSILLKKTFYEKANRKQLNNILKHEMTHAWLCRKQQMSGHDERFKKKFKEVGGFGN